jgi:hypothetical protein
VKRLAIAAALVTTVTVAGGAMSLVVWRRARPPTPGKRSHRELSGAPYPLQPAGRRMGATGGNPRILGPRREPRALRRLAEWVPAAPATPVTRVLAYLWAAPLSVAGLLVGLASGARPVLREGVLLFPEARGLSGLVLRARHYDATAIGHVVIATKDPSPALLAHELVHVRHAERFGAAFAPLYAGLWLVYGYARHPMERAARLGVRRGAQAPD